MKVHRSLDSRPIQAKPHPEHPFANGDGFVFTITEPDHGQQEASKAPHGEHRKDGEVAHHLAERYEEHIFGH